MPRGRYTSGADINIEVSVLIEQDSSYKLRLRGIFQIWSYSNSTLKTVYNLLIWPTPNL